MRMRHVANAEGAWYVDTACINCRAAQTVAPGLIIERDGQSVFAHQPATEAEVMEAWRARLLCPTASVHGTEESDAVATEAFPEAMTNGVFRLGYNARSSWGAHSFLIERTRGNTMVDAPRWTRAAADAIERRGGLALILLTHRDDVADAGRYAAHFGARVVIHEADRDAAPYASEILTGSAPIALDDDLLVIPLPGHTKGSVAYLARGDCLFTGDSLSWSFEQGDLRASRDVCWYSWPEQIRSLRRLLDQSFAWVFAGHGGSIHLPPAEMRQRLAALVARMERQ
jgi:glyoxylase-like metal-dependent hydrolase (beta-lactamase superfamily II)